MRAATPQQLGGQAVLKKYGRTHFQKLGRKGFQTTVDRYFAGDRQAATSWLWQKGIYTIDQNLSPWLRVFQDPGPHPAHATTNNQ